MSFRQIGEARLTGEAQPVAHVRLFPAALAERCGIAFATVADDLDRLARAAVEVDGMRFALQRYAHNPEPGTEILAYDAGDPATQAVAVTSALEIADAVDTWWDGSRWRHDRLPRGLNGANVDLPAWVAGALDREAKRLGVARQSVVKVWSRCVSGTRSG